MEEIKEAKQKKSIFKKWWFWVIVVIFIIIIINSNGTKQTSETSTNVKISQIQQQKTEYNKGEEAILGNGAITVTNVEKSQGGTYDKPNSGKEFVIVYVTITNKGTSNLSYNPYYFKMQNSNGQQEDITFTSIDQDTSLSSGELIPGGVVSGTLSFEEPINDSKLVLIYNDNVWSSKELKINL